MNSAAAAVAFRATNQLGGKTTTGIEVPDDVASALGSGRRPAVHATIAGYSNRRRFVLGIEGAKTLETRRHRIAKMVATLRADAA